MAAIGGRHRPSLPELGGRRHRAAGVAVRWATLAVTADRRRRGVDAARRRHRHQPARVRLAVTL